MSKYSYKVDYSILVSLGNRDVSLTSSFRL